METSWTTEHGRRPPGSAHMDLGPGVSTPEVTPGTTDPAAVGGRLQEFWRVWQDLFPNSPVPSWLRTGIKWQFHTRPVLSCTPIRFPTQPEQLPLLHQAAMDLVRKGAVEQLQTPVESLGFYSRLFLRPKPTGEWRPIIDLSQLNDLIVCVSFKMETPKSIQQAVQPGEWTFQIDIKDAYLHIPVRESYRKYLRFSVGREVFQFRTLPFGLSVAPRIFTLTLRPVIALLRSQGIRVHAYLDDWLGRALSQSMAHSHGLEVIQLLVRLGWVINWDKSDISGSQTVVFLGIFFDLQRAVVMPGQKAISSMDNTIAGLSTGMLISARDMASIIGKIKHWAPYVPRGRLRLRPIQRWLAQRWNQAEERWSHQLLIDKKLIHLLRWWRKKKFLSAGVPLLPPEPVLDLFTDASTVGWGAELHGNIARGQWTRNQRRLHINRLELEAVSLAVKRFLPFLRGKVTRVHVDNSTVVAYLRKEGGTRSWSLTEATSKLLRWCDCHRVSLVPVHIAGLQNVVADSLSRIGQVQATEWAISQGEFLRICQALGRPQVDLMATATNRVVTEFISPMPHPEALGVDVFVVPWPLNKRLYVFPPTALVQRILNWRKRSSAQEVILVASMAPSRPFHPDLLQMARFPPLPVCSSPGSLWQQVAGTGDVVWHSHPALFSLGAWLI